MKNYLITAGIALGVVVIWGTLFAPVQKVINQTTQLGAVASPDIMSPYFSFGGVRQWAGHTDSLTQATTTVCAIQSPAATSTLVYGTIKMTVSSTTASTITLAKAATAYATTTSLGTWAAAANSQGTAVSLRTAAGGEDLDETFGPNQWFVVGMAGGTGTFSPTGTCQAVWIEL